MSLVTSFETLRQFGPMEGLGVLLVGSIKEKQPSVY